MTIGDSTVLFFDASCLVAAAGSPSGGSAFLLSLCGRGSFKAAASQPVLLEAERNISFKLGAEALGRYHRPVVLTPLIIVSLPPEATLHQYRTIAGEKDEHVVAAAIGAQAEFLLLATEVAPGSTKSACADCCARGPDPRTCGPPPLAQSTGATLATLLGNAPGWTPKLSLRTNDWRLEVRGGACRLPAQSC